MMQNVTGLSVADKYECRIPLAGFRGKSDRLRQRAKSYLTRPDRPKSSRCRAIVQHADLCFPLEPISGSHR